MGANFNGNGYGNSNRNYSNGNYNNQRNSVNKYKKPNYYQDAASGVRYNVSSPSDGNISVAKMSGFDHRYASSSAAVASYKKSTSEAGSNYAKADMSGNRVVCEPRGGNYGQINNTTKNILNVVRQCYVNKTKSGGIVLSLLPDLPMWGFLNDYMFFLTIPANNQNSAAAYCRIQDKSKFSAEQLELESQVVPDIKSFQSFDQVKEPGYIKTTKRDNGELIVCVPRTRIFVDFSKIVVIANVPSDPTKDKTVVYIRKKLYMKNKNELALSVDNCAGNDYNDDDCEICECHCDCYESDEGADERRCKETIFWDDSAAVMATTAAKVTHCEGRAPSMPSMPSKPSSD